MYNCVVYKMASHLLFLSQSQAQNGAPEHLPPQNLQLQNLPPQNGTPDNSAKSFSLGLFDTCNDCSDKTWCWIAVWHPCRVGRTMERSKAGSFETFFILASVLYIVALIFLILNSRGMKWAVWGFLFTYLIMAVVYTRNRMKLRDQYGIQKDQAGDFVSQCCCMPCSLAQEARHVDAHRKDESSDNSSV